MPTNNPTIPADAQRVLTDLKANILDAADDALLDAYAVGRDAGLTEQQAKLDTVVAERARTTNHLYGLLQTKDGELVRARELAAARRRDLAHYAERIAELEATDKRNRERLAELEHDLRVSEANRATERERTTPRPEPAVGGHLPWPRIGEVAYTRDDVCPGYSRFVTDTPANIRRRYNARVGDIVALEFPIGHIVWAKDPVVLSEIRRLFHGK